MEGLSELRRLVDGSRSMVFFGGAGVSTESGIPDFRSADGLYSGQFDLPPEYILSHSYFMQDPAGFFRFYRARMLCPDAQPNAAHRALAALEREGRLQAVITQNIDGLHQKAGSTRVLELHGSVERNRCMRCGRSFPLSFVSEGEGVPRCPCGGIVKPDVVLYEEPLDERTVQAAVEALARADLLLVGGTSLAVYPAAGLLQYYRGRALVLINRDPTPADGRATLRFRQPIGQVLGALGR